MTDPFEALHEPVTPVDPDPEFTRQLRQRLTREVFTSSGGAMSQQTVAARVEREPASPPTLTPHIVVSDARPPEETCCCPPLLTEPTGMNLTPERCIACIASNRTCGCDS